MPQSLSAPVKSATGYPAPPHGPPGQTGFGLSREGRGPALKPNPPEDPGSFHAPEFCFTKNGAIPRSEARVRAYTGTSHAIRQRSDSWTLPKYAYTIKAVGKSGW
jgi:hypothetical protein